MRHSLIVGFTATLLLLLGTSQCKLMKDDLSSCPQGVAFTFYSQSPCNEMLPFNEVKNIELQVYDDKGKWVQTFDESEIQFSKKGSIWTIPFNKKGTYHFTFWGKEDAQAYSRTQDASIRYNKASVAVEKDIPALFFGKQTHHFEDRSQLGTKIDTLGVNLIPYKFNLHINVVGFRGKNITDKGYTIEIKDENAAYDRQGKVIPSPIIYKRDAFAQNNELKVDLSTLLISNKNYNNKGEREKAAHIVIKRKEDQALIYDLNLNDFFDQLKLNLGEDVDIACINKKTGKANDLNIFIDITTFERIVVIINDWNVIFREDRV